MDLYIEKIFHKSIVIIINNLKAIVTDLATYGTTGYVVDIPLNKT